MASASRIDEALELVGRSRGTTSSIEPRMLAAAVEAICALKGRDRAAIRHVEALIETAFATGAVDLLVTAYRSSPELLTVLLRGGRERDAVIGLLRRAGDGDLARAVGRAVSPEDDPRDGLTPRERQVYDLLCESLSNAQIAALLYISELTVKAHVHHIFDKLGTRSRTALAMQAALERASHATSATRGVGPTDDS